MSVSANLGNCFRQDFICLSALFLSPFTLVVENQIDTKYLSADCQKHFTTEQNFCGKGPPSLFTRSCLKTIYIFQIKIIKSSLINLINITIAIPIKMIRNKGLPIKIKTNGSPSGENVWTALLWSRFVQLTKCSRILPPVGWC